MIDHYNERGGAYVMGADGVLRPDAGTPEVPPPPPEPAPDPLAERGGVYQAGDAGELQAAEDLPAPELPAPPEPLPPGAITRDPVTGALMSAQALRDLQILRARSARPPQADTPPEAPQAPSVLPAKRRRPNTTQE